MEFKKYKITNISDTADKIRIFLLEPVDGINIAFKPGQFVKIYDLERKMFRPYSMTSLSSANILEFAIKLEGGSFTSYLASLKAGDCVWIEGPLGHFYYNGENKVAFIAGGIGIAPLIGMIREIAAEKKSGDFILFYSAKSSSDFAYFEELKKLGKLQKNIKIVFALTREKPDSGDWELKRIDADMIKKYVPNPGEFHWYVCGPLKMTFGLKDVLLKLGIRPENIKFEGWG